MHFFSPRLLLATAALAGAFLSAPNAKAQCASTRAGSSHCGRAAPAVCCETRRSAPACGCSTVPPKGVFGACPSPSAPYGYDVDGAPIISMGPLETKTQEYTVSRDPDDDFELVPMIRDILVNKLNLSEQEASTLINNYQESQSP